MKYVLFIVALTTILETAYTQDTIFYKFWIAFSDKNGTPYSINSPQDFLSERAIQRRNLHYIPVTESDLPVNPSYTDSLLKHGVKVLYTSKWFNASVIETMDSSLITPINHLSFVVHSMLLFRGKTVSNMTRKALHNNDDSDVLDYGMAGQQIRIHHGEELHDEGFQGQDMVIAVLDAGFMDADTLRAFDSLHINGRILGTRDFVLSGNDVYRENYHGMKVLSIMGGNIPGELIGTAPRASYWLLRSEDVSSEYKIEEANWIAAAEFADSAGTDIINSSLGYSRFDDSLQNYTYEDMDGNTTLVTKGADMAASKGILVVVSAGNEGNKTWKYITAPADGDSVLALGAVDQYGFYASFSSLGPTSDGRVKPNVVAIGSGTYIQKPDGMVGSGKGTSFSAPVMSGLAACLWQKFRELSNLEIISALEKSASIYPYPNNFIGYGIPNIGVANDLITGNTKFFSPQDLLIYPDPVTDVLSADLPPNTGKIITWEILDLSGMKVMFSKSEINPYDKQLSVTSLENLRPGMYILRIISENNSFTGKFIKK